MKATILGLFLIIMSAQLSFAQNSATKSFTTAEQEIVNLSKDKWQWMSDKNADVLDNLFQEKAVFVHMGGSWGKEQEINIIKSGGFGTRKQISMKYL